MKTFLSRRWLILLAILVALGLAAVAVPFLMEEPLRRTMEARMNRALKGYTIQIGRVYLHPIGFSLELKDSIVRQDKHPDPPVARIPRLVASVFWRELLHAHVVGDLLIDRPQVYVNIENIRREMEGRIPFRQVQIYAAEQEKGKSLLQKIYEGLLQGLADLLERRPAERVATKTDISGSLKNPHISTWQAIRNVLANAFFTAILPGFERQIHRPGRKK